jgi:hypothetical protein
LTKYTSPKLPLPSILIGIKFAGPIFSSSVAEDPLLLLLLSPDIDVNVYDGYTLAICSVIRSVLVCECPTVFLFFDD